MSQRAQRRSSRAHSSQSEEDTTLEEPINKCVQYFLSRESSKIPVKRADLLKMLSTTCETPSNKINFVVAGANRKLKQVYGYKLVQIMTKNGVVYILVLNKSCDSTLSILTDTYHRQLLTASLTHIFMSGGTVRDDDMWKFLAEADLLEDSDYGGRKILTSIFTKQLYLSYSKVGEEDLARYVFQWGNRATEEWPKINVLEKMSAAFDKDVTHWCEQHRAATEDVEEPAEASGSNRN